MWHDEGKAAYLLKERTIPPVKYGDGSNSLFGAALLQLSDFCNLRQPTPNQQKPRFGQLMLVFETPVTPLRKSYMAYVYDPPHPIFTREGVTQ